MTVPAAEGQEKRTAVAVWKMRVRSMEEDAERFQSSQ